MSLDYAEEHLLAAVERLAGDDETLLVRLQGAWTDHVQMLWMKPCLSAELNERYRSLWTQYTAPSSDRHATQLRALDAQQVRDAAVAIVRLAADTVRASANGESPAT